MKIEIKNAPSQKVDWSKGSQLVINNTIVILTSKHPGCRSELFCGTVIMPGYGTARSVGEYSNSWVKSMFQPFNGEITLKND